MLVSQLFILPILILIVIPSCIAILTSPSFSPILNLLQSNSSFVLFTDIDETLIIANTSFNTESSLTNDFLASLDSNPDFGSHDTDFFLSEMSDMYYSSSSILMEPNLPQNLAESLSSSGPRGRFFPLTSRDPELLQCGETISSTLSRLGFDVLLDPTLDGIVGHQFEVHSGIIFSTVPHANKGEIIQELLEIWKHSSRGTVLVTDVVFVDNTLSKCEDVDRVLPVLGERNQIFHYTRIESPEMKDSLFSTSRMLDQFGDIVGLWNLKKKKKLKTTLLGIVITGSVYCAVLCVFVVVLALSLCSMCAILRGAGIGMNGQGSGGKSGQKDVEHQGLLQGSIQSD